MSTSSGVGVITSALAIVASPSSSCTTYDLLNVGLCIYVSDEKSELRWITMCWANSFCVCVCVWKALKKFKQPIYT
ncbi:hypothetical protein LX32DRAFT_235157 [Colletotrichum zoysiae]|uniref:Uncharacterized protein n=1 Tax=Colletotrichum zoysiae TaxID=1216348 RepID=A0AAD9H569_9PEZI|nr:hypothetical protein LX32DRAFT_235157 [Colletotrichum zoysiae]